MVLPIVASNAVQLSGSNFAAVATANSAAASRGIIGCCCSQVYCLWGCLGTCLICTGVLAGLPFAFAGDPNAVDKKYAGGDCGECSRRKATIVCHECQEAYCQTCCRLVHNRGYRVEHRKLQLIPVKQQKKEPKAKAKARAKPGAKAAKAKGSAKPAAKGAKGKAKPAAKGKAKAKAKAKPPAGPLYESDDDEISLFVPKHPCGECESSIATFFCLDCKEVYCTPCKATVHGKGLRQRHNKLIPLTGVLEPEFDEERALASIEAALEEKRQKAAKGGPRPAPKAAPAAARPPEREVVDIDEDTIVAEGSTTQEVPRPRVVAVDEDDDVGGAGHLLLSVPPEVMELD